MPSWFPIEAYERHYLATDEPLRQSGFGGDAAYWELARKPVVAAVDRPGTYLDIGCASGVLMESVARWAPVEPYGLEWSPRLAEIARKRLPAWADRIWCGDARIWEGPMRFDYVRTELDYAPPGEERALVEHLLGRVVAPDGKLVVCGYGSRKDLDNRAPDVALQLHRWGFPVRGEATAVAENGVVVCRVAWVQAQ
jgi:hypothetical protein